MNNKTCADSAGGTDEDELMTNETDDQSSEKKSCQNLDDQIVDKPAETSVGLIKANIKTSEL